MSRLLRELSRLAELPVAIGILLLAVFFVIWLLPLH